MIGLKFRKAYLDYIDKESFLKRIRILDFTLFSQEEGVSYRKVTLGGVNSV